MNDNFRIFSQKFVIKIFVKSYFDNEIYCHLRFRFFRNEISKIFDDFIYSYDSYFWSKVELKIKAEDLKLTWVTFWK